MERWPDGTPVTQSPTGLDWEISDNPNRLNARGHLVLAVWDNGPGIAAENIDDIFVPFFTTKREGSEVGLALSRQSMIPHGGSMTFRQTELGDAGFALIF